MKINFSAIKSWFVDDEDIMSALGAKLDKNDLYLRQTKIICRTVAIVLVTFLLYWGFVAYRNLRINALHVGHPIYNPPACIAGEVRVFLTVADKQNQSTCMSLNQIAEIVQRERTVPSTNIQNP